MALGGEFQGRLKKKIEERMNSILENLVSGVEDTKYRELVGRVQSFKEVLAMCEETESDMNKDN